MKIFSLLLAISFCQLLTAQNRIKIELRFTPGQLKDSGMVSFMPVNYILAPKSIPELKRPSNGFLKITKEMDGPTYMNFYNLVQNNILGYYLTEPGDEVVISPNGEGFHFLGKGAEKYRMQYQLDSVAKSIPKANNKRGLASFSIDSIGEYFDWEHYFQKTIDLGLPLIDSYKGKVSDFAYKLIKDHYINDAIDNLSDKFGALKQYITSKKIRVEKLVHIYDSSFSKSIEKWVNHAVDKQAVEQRTRFDRVSRLFLFDETRASRSDINWLLYKDLLGIYKGEEREKLIVNGFPGLVMNNIGFTPEVEKILRDYYAEPTYPELKKYVQEAETIVRRNKLRGGAPEFTLVDKNGMLLTREMLKDKFVVLCFWKSDNVESKRQMANIMNIEKMFAGNMKVQFVYVSVDSDRTKWLKNISGASTYGIHAYTGGQGTANEIVKRYAVAKYPTVYLFSPEGKGMNISPEIDFTKDEGKTLKELLLKNVVALPYDGPYVLYNGNASTSYYIQDSLVRKAQFTTNQSPLLSVQTDLGIPFQVKLQSTLSIQPVEYSQPEKLLVLSDIEGNFDAFRKLLQSNKIIDKNYNWTFDKGHLVFAGDMFDRGYQVTECLWLIYSLEAKAKTAGGYVHFVLGNHEIMNLQGFHRYVRDKYVKNAKLMGKTLTELYNEESELGRWLRTKNVIEKIGDLLFVHGGISPEVNRLPLTIEEINKIVRPYYDKAVDSSNSTLLALYDSRFGEKYRISPFWSRGYYQSRGGKGLISNAQLDSTLQKFNVRHIITGHTIVADTISVHYGTKVINTDTHHASAKSEALLILGNHFYRVNAEGKKVLLFIDDKRKQTVNHPRRNHPTQ